MKIPGRSQFCNRDNTMKFNSNSFPWYDIYLATIAFHLGWLKSARNFSCFQN